MFKNYRVRDYDFKLIFMLVAITIIGILAIGSAKESVQNIRKITILVDMSGCLYTKKSGGISKTIISSMFRNEFIFSLCFIINCEKNKINIIFVNSDG